MKCLLLQLNQQQQNYKQQKINLTEQKLVMEDVLDLVTSYEQSAELKAMVAQLQPIVTAFDAVEKEEANSNVSKSGGALIIGGGPSYTASEEVLSQITEAVGSVRNELIK